MGLSSVVVDATSNYCFVSGNVAGRILMSPFFINLVYCSCYPDSLGIFSAISAYGGSDWYLLFICFGRSYFDQVPRCVLGRTYNMLLISPKLQRHREIIFESPAFVILQWRFLTLYRDHVVLEYSCVAKLEERYWFLSFHRAV